MKSIGVALLMLLAIAGQGALPVAGQNLQPLVGGMKFNDLNGDGEWQQNEPGLQGWTVCLKLISAPVQPATAGCSLSDPHATTDAGGLFEISGNVPDGMYEVIEVQQSGWQQTTKPCTVQVRNPNQNSAAQDGIECFIGNHRMPQEVPESDTLWLFAAGAVALIGYMVYQRKFNPAHRI